MKDLASRQADRVMRKAENALACGVLFDTSRGGVGVAKKHGRASEVDAAGINAATDAIIARVVEAIGAAPMPADLEGFLSPLAPKVKLSGVQGERTEGGTGPLCVECGQQNQAFSRPIWLPVPPPNIAVCSCHVT